MQFIDTHTHINLNAFAEDSAEVIKRADEAGVVVVNVGTQIDTSKAAVQMLKDYPDKEIYAVVGLHPSHTYSHDFIDNDEVVNKTKEESFDYQMYKQLVVTDNRVVGIGECGLDYYRLPEGADLAQIKALQKHAFESQIKLALETDKALCIHCRPSENGNDAYEDVLDMLKNYSGLRFEIHCFTGDLETAQRFVDLGGYIGINGIITFDKTSRSRDVVEGLSIENIILETDAPYLSPKPYRGKRNEPAFMVETAMQIAEWKNLTLEEVANITTANAKKLFKI